MSLFSVFRQTVEVIRVKNAIYDDAGDWTGEDASTLLIQASVQPASPNDLKSVPEARRQSEAYVLYTDSELNTVELQNPDKIILNGKKFEIHNSSRWQNGLIDHFKYIALKMDIER